MKSLKYVSIPFNMKMITTYAKLIRKESENMNPDTDQICYYTERIEEVAELILKNNPDEAK